MNDEGKVLIQQPGKIRLRVEEKAVLRGMYHDYIRIAIEAEFGMGLSGCRVFRIRPVEASGVTHRPALIKIGPLDLINKEWQAYETWVKNTLPRIAWVTSAPISVPDSTWGGLRYELVGGGIFEVKSLSQYFRQASNEDLLWVLQRRLFPVMSRSWWRVNRTERTFQFQADYDQFLPINLLISADPSPTGNTTQSITPEEQFPDVLTIGNRVAVSDFMITEKDAERRQLTLNVPQRSDHPLREQTRDSFRLRIDGVPSFERYQLGDVIEPITGIIISNRRSLLLEQAQKSLGESVDLSQDPINLLGGLSLPNPLMAYEDILSEFHEVNISTIHGDFNLENILVDPATRDVRVIDFATVRQGHNLHDLLRLETEVVTKLIPEIFAAEALPPETIIDFYRLVNQRTLPGNGSSNPRLPHDSLNKPFAMLLAIRQEAARCSFDVSEKSSDYLKGLILYLLGALKFKNLDAIPEAKKVAFLAAATHLDWISPTSEVIPAREVPFVAPKGDTSVAEKAPSQSKGSWALKAALLGIFGVIVAIIVFIILRPDPVPVDALCEINRNLSYQFESGQAAAPDVISLFELANPGLFNHIDSIERAYLNGDDHKGITYIWGAPGVGKSFISRNRLGEGFPGDSCLVKLSDLFNDETDKLSFVVDRQPELVSLDNQLVFDTLPGVAQPDEFDLANLFVAAECVQDGQLVPLVIIDDIDEVRKDTSNLILRSLDQLVLETDLGENGFLQVFVLGRTEGFAPWYQDPKRNGDIAPFLNVYWLNGPELKSTGDLEVLADNQYAFVLGAERWAEMIQDGTAEQFIQDYVDFIEQHPILSYSVRTLSIATFIADRARTSDDTEIELENFLFDELLRRASETHNRPPANDDQYRAMLEEIAVQYAGADQVDGQGFFTVGLNDTIPVVDGEQIISEVSVRDVLDHSGIAAMEPASYSTTRYRFEPFWVHAHLVELYNLRHGLRREYVACYP